MRNYKKEDERDAQIYKRLTFKTPKYLWDALSPQQQAECKLKVKELINDCVKLPPPECDIKERKNAMYPTLEKILERVIYGTKIIIKQCNGGSRIYYDGEWEYQSDTTQFSKSLLSSEVCEFSTSGKKLVIGISAE